MEEFDFVGSPNKGRRYVVKFGEPLEANLLGDGTGDMDCAPFEAFGFEDLCTSFSEPLLLREDKIFDGNVQIYYPISGLYSIYQGMKTQQSLLESKESDTQKQVLAIQKQVSDLYFQMLHLEHVMDFTQQTYDGLLQTKKRFCYGGTGTCKSIGSSKIRVWFA